jgi:hypothetical protein
LRSLGQVLQFLDFAVTEQRGGIAFRPRLKHLASHLRACACSQFRQFAERFGGGCGRGASASFEAGENCLFR